MNTTGSGHDHDFAVIGGIHVGRKGWTDEVIKEMKENGMSFDEIASEFSVSVGSICGHIYRIPEKRWTDEDMKRLQEMRENDMSKKFWVTFFVGKRQRPVVIFGKALSIFNPLPCKLTGILGAINSYTRSLSMVPKQ